MIDDYIIMDLKFEMFGPVTMEKFKKGDKVIFVPQGGSRSVNFNYPRLFEEVTIGDVMGDFAYAISEYLFNKRHTYQTFNKQLLMSRSKFEDLLITNPAYLLECSRRYQEFLDLSSGKTNSLILLKKTIVWKKK